MRSGRDRAPSLEADSRLRAKLTASEQACDASWRQTAPEASDAERPAPQDVLLYRALVSARRQAWSRPARPPAPPSPGTTCLGPAVPPRRLAAFALLDCILRGDLEGVKRELQRIQADAVAAGCSAASATTAAAEACDTLCFWVTSHGTARGRGMQPVACQPPAGPTAWQSPCQNPTTTSANGAPAQMASPLRQSKGPSGGGGGDGGGDPVTNPQCADSSPTAAAAAVLPEWPPTGSLATIASVIPATLPVPAFRSANAAFPGLPYGREALARLRSHDYLRHGCTPLSTAAALGHLDIVRLLLEYGASPDAPSVPMPTPSASAPLACAKSSAHHTNHRLASDRPQHPYGTHRRLEGAAAAATASPVPPWPPGAPRCWVSPLAAAALWGDTEVLVLLLCRGADPTRLCWLDDGGLTFTALHVTPSWEVAEALLSAAATGTRAGAATSSTGSVDSMSGPAPAPMRQTPPQRRAEAPEPGPSPQSWSRSRSQARDRGWKDAEGHSSLRHTGLLVDTAAAARTLPIVKDHRLSAPGLPPLYRLGGGPEGRALASNGAGADGGAGGGDAVAGAVLDQPDVLEGLCGAAGAALTGEVEPRAGGGGGVGSGGAGRPNATGLGVVSGLALTASASLFARIVLSNGSKGTAVQLNPSCLLLAAMMEDRTDADAAWLDQQQQQQQQQHQQCTTHGSLLRPPLDELPNAGVSEQGQHASWKGFPAASDADAEAGGTLAPAAAEVPTTPRSDTLRSTVTIAKAPSTHKHASPWGSLRLLINPAGELARDATWSRDLVAQPQQDPPQQAHTPDPACAWIARYGTDLECLWGRLWLLHAADPRLAACWVQLIGRDLGVAALSTSAPTCVSSVGGKAGVAECSSAARTGSSGASADVGHTPSPFMNPAFVPTEALSSRRHAATPLVSFPRQPSAAPPPAASAAPNGDAVHTFPAGASSGAVSATLPTIPSIAVSAAPPPEPQPHWNSYLTAPLVTALQHLATAAAIMQLTLDSCTLVRQGTDTDSSAAVKGMDRSLGSAAAGRAELESQAPALASAAHGSEARACARADDEAEAQYASLRDVSLGSLAVLCATGAAARRLPQAHLHTSYWFGDCTERWLQRVSARLCAVEDTHSLSIPPSVGGRLQPSLRQRRELHWPYDDPWVTIQDVYHDAYVPPCFVPGPPAPALASTSWLDRRARAMPEAAWSAFTAAFYATPVDVAAACRTFAAGLSKLAEEVVAVVPTATAGSGVGSCQPTGAMWHSPSVWKHRRKAGALQTDAACHFILEAGLPWLLAQTKVLEAPLPGPGAPAGLGDGRAVAAAALPVLLGMPSYRGKSTLDSKAKARRLRTRGLDIDGGGSRDGLDGYDRASMQQQHHQSSLVTVAQGSSLPGWRILVEGMMESLSAITSKLDIELVGELIEVIATHVEQRGPGRSGASDQRRGARGAQSYTTALTGASTAAAPAPPGPQPQAMSPQHGGGGGGVQSICTGEEPAGRDALPLLLAAAVAATAAPVYGHFQLQHYLRGGAMAARTCPQLQPRALRAVLLSVSRLLEERCAQGAAALHVAATGGGVSADATAEEVATAAATAAAAAARSAVVSSLMSVSFEPWEEILVSRKGASPARLGTRISLQAELTALLEAAAPLYRHLHPELVALLCRSVLEVGPDSALMRRSVSALARRLRAVRPACSPQVQVLVESLLRHRPRYAAVLLIETGLGWPRVLHGADGGGCGGSWDGGLRVTTLPALKTTLVSDFTAPPTRLLKSKSVEGLQPITLRLSNLRMGQEDKSGAEPQNDPGGGFTGAAVAGPVGTVAPGAVQGHPARSSLGGGGTFLGLGRPVARPLFSVPSFPLPTSGLSFMSGTAEAASSAAGGLFRGSLDDGLIAVGGGIGVGIDDDSFAGGAAGAGAARGDPSGITARVYAAAAATDAALSALGGSSGYSVRRRLDIMTRCDGLLTFAHTVFVAVLYPTTMSGVEPVATDDFDEAVEAYRAESVVEGGRTEGVGPRRSGISGVSSRGGGGSRSGISRSGGDRNRSGNGRSGNGGGDNRGGNGRGGGSRWWPRWPRFLLAMCGAILGMSTGDLAMLRVTAKRSFKIRRLAALALLTQGWTGAGAVVAALYYAAGTVTAGAAVIAAVAGVLAGCLVRLCTLVSRGFSKSRPGWASGISRGIHAYIAKLPRFLREEPPVQIDERFAYPAALRMPLLPGITTTLVPHYTDLLEALLHDRSVPPQLWRAPPMMVLVLHIWRTFTRHVIILMFMQRVLYTLLFILYALSLHRGLQLGDGQPRKCASHATKYQFGLMGALALMLAENVVVELRQLWEDGFFTWVLQPWNVCDAVDCGLMATVLGLHLSCNASLDVLRSLAQIEMLVLFWRLMYYAMGLRHLGSFVRMVLEVTYDLRVFFVFLAAVYCGFALAIIVVVPDKFEIEGAEVDRVKYVFARLYAMLFGDFDYNLLLDPGLGMVKMSYMTATICAIYMLFVSIILLNILIAIVGDAYDRVRGNDIVNDMRSKAAMIVEVDRLMPRWLRQMRDEQVLYCDALLVLQREDEAPIGSRVDGRGGNGVPSGPSPDWNDSKDDRWAGADNCFSPRQEPLGGRGLDDWDYHLELFGSYTNGLTSGDSLIGGTESLSGAWQGRLGAIVTSIESGTRATCAAMANMLVQQHEQQRRSAHELVRRAGEEAAHRAAAAAAEAAARQLAAVRGDAGGGCGGSGVVRQSAAAAAASAAGGDTAALRAEIATQMRELLSEVKSQLRAESTSLQAELGASLEQMTTQLEARLATRITGLEERFGGGSSGGAGAGSA